MALLHRHSPRRGTDVIRHLEERAAWIRATGLEGFSTRQPVKVPDRPMPHGRTSNSLPGLLRAAGRGRRLRVRCGRRPGPPASRRSSRLLRNKASTPRYLKPSLRSSLRGYQSFGASYALVQRRCCSVTRWGWARPSRPSRRWGTSPPRGQTLRCRLPPGRARQLDQGSPQAQSDLEVPGSRRVVRPGAGPAAMA